MNRFGPLVINILLFVLLGIIPYSSAYYVKYIADSRNVSINAVPEATNLGYLIGGSIIAGWLLFLASSGLRNKQKLKDQ